MKTQQKAEPIPHPENDKAWLNIPMWERRRLYEEDQRSRNDRVSREREHLATNKAQHSPQWNNNSVEAIRDELLKVKQERDDLQAHADKLAEALRELVDAPNDLHNRIVAIDRLKAWEAAQ